MSHTSLLKSLNYLITGFDIHNGPVVLLSSIQNTKVLTAIALKGQLSIGMGVEKKTFHTYAIHPFIEIHKVGYIYYFRKNDTHLAIIYLFDEKYHTSIHQYLEVFRKKSELIIQEVLKYQNLYSFDFLLKNPDYLRTKLVDICTPDPKDFHNAKHLESLLEDMMVASKLQ